MKFARHTPDPASWQRFGTAMCIRLMYRTGRHTTTRTCSSASNLNSTSIPASAPRLLRRLGTPAPPLAPSPSPAGVEVSPATGPSAAPSAAVLLTVENNDPWVVRGVFLGGLGARVTRVIGSGSARPPTSSSQEVASKSAL